MSRDWNKTAPYNKGLAENSYMRLESQDRYSRQVLFPGIGTEGQRKLKESRVAIVGCGATGSAVGAGALGL